MKAIASVVAAGALLFVFFLSGCGNSKSSSRGNSSANPYPPFSTTSGNDSSIGKNLAYLQKNFSQSFVNPAPWAGYWWPYAADGISRAASKYDAVQSGSALSWELSHHGSGLGDVPSWWGHCNGWTAAAILAPEPVAPKAIGGVQFDVSDQKALLSETYMEVTGDFLGNRVDDPDDFSSPAFEDVTPAQFHLVLTSLVGSQKRAFAMDRFTGYQVWNHPVVAYETAPITKEDYLGTDPRYPNVHRVNVTTRVWWVDDNVDPDVVTPAFDPNEPDPRVFSSRTLRYELWLDAPPNFNSAGNLESSGNIIATSSGGRDVGGAWKTGYLTPESSHPDYIWIPTGPSQSSGYKNPNLPDSWVISNTR